MKTGRNVALAAHPDNVLLDEVRRPEYDGLTEEAAYAHLFAERVQEITEYDRITVPVAARVLGPEKTEALVSAVEAAYPKTAQYLLEAGFDPRFPAVAEFLAQALSADDADRLATAVSRVTRTTLPPRSVERFSGVAGMPNLVSPEAFSVAFKSR